MAHPQRQQHDDESSDLGAMRCADWSSSPIPPPWRKGGGSNKGIGRCIPSVEPALHSRVRSLPKHTRSNQEQHESDRDDEDDEGDGSDNQDDDVCTELKALTQCQLVAPQPRRAISPELIFSSAAESLTRHKRLRSSAAQPPASASSSTSEEYESPIPFFHPPGHFRSIGADRPDVETTSPPLRAANPVILDSRFQGMTKLNLKKDAIGAPVQPFYSRASHRTPRS